MRGRRASPPPGVDSNGRILTADGIHKSDLRLLGDDDERKVCFVSFTAWKSLEFCDTLSHNDVEI